MSALHWDIFCRVIDNHGDVGVCWRLACQLAGAGDRVRLFIDDDSALAWMAPAGCQGVQVVAWPHADSGQLEAGDVVIEAFGCDPPTKFVNAMARQMAPPVWINLEYLSAETYVERSHGLPSPQSNGLTKWFFYPGFTERTGGLLREHGLMVARDSFKRDDWLAGQQMPRRPDERVVSLFCYDNPRMPGLLQLLAGAPTQLLLTQGHAQRQVVQVPTGVHTQRLPWLTHEDFDHLLWAGDINFVRGEDSLVRALWAGVPFVWQLYPQQDGAHAAKLEAMLSWLQADDDVAALWRWWNGLPTVPPPALPEMHAWRQLCGRARERLLSQMDLATQLRQFVGKKLLRDC